jgi:hypothetical protein
MARPVFRRHQHIDGVAEQFRARVAEHLFDFRINELDRACLVRDQHAAGTGLDHKAEALFSATTLSYFGFDGVRFAKAWRFAGITTVINSIRANAIFRHSSLPGQRWHNPVW